MKKRALLFVAILILTLWVIHCEKGVTPFNPESDVEKQSESEATSGNTETVSRTTGSSLVDIGKNSTTIRENVKSKSDFYSHYASADRRIGGKDTGNRISDFMANRSGSAKKIQTVKREQAIEKGVLENQKKEMEEAEGLQLMIQPEQWNKNWTHSEGLVTVRIKGEGFDKIVSGSIKMAYGPCLENNTLQNDFKLPVFEKVSGSSYIAKFKQSDAISLITDPKRGEKHWIHVTGDIDGADSFCLDYEITIIGKKDEVDMALVIRPKKWNIAWADGDINYGGDDGDDDGDGLITARISGTKFEDIELGTVSMDYGACSDGDTGVLEAVHPVSEQMGGSAYISKFNQSEAISLIQGLKTGETHYIHVTGNLVGGGSFCLDFLITLTGKKSEDEGFSLDMKPDKWDMSWADSASITLDAGDDGFVRARIRGEGFENIDPTTVVMSCASCVESGELSVISPTEHEFGGASFVAKFLKSEAIQLIKDPERGETHVIQVSGKLKDGASFETTDTIEIKGKKK